MAKVRDWEGMRAMPARLLEERTGHDVAAWNRRIHETMPFQIGLNGRKDVDSEVLGWLRKAYEENR